MRPLYRKSQPTMSLLISDGGFGGAAISNEHDLKLGARYVDTIECSLLHLHGEKPVNVCIGVHASLYE
ncbi:MAG: hypothetical protein QOH31_3558 [Verrucomicrobiota bacterium]